VAPQSGAETRRELRRGADRARRKAVTAAEDIGEKVRERFLDAKEYVEDELDSAKRVVRAKKRALEGAVEVGREAARNTRAKLERTVEETKAAFEAGADHARGSRRAAAADMSSERPADA
jgi:hypothetical protein